MSNTKPIEMTSGHLKVVRTQDGPWMKVNPPAADGTMNSFGRVAIHKDCMSREDLADLALAFGNVRYPKSLRDQIQQALN